MLPLDPMFLMFLKFFIVMTCIVFWVRLAIQHLSRGYGVHRGRRADRRLPKDEEEEADET